MSELATKRTLVKSPPELWAEVSDLPALARHLGEFGEIRITRLEPETTVVWEGEHASGTVRLEPGGWGTKVTLTAELAGAEELAPRHTPSPMPAAATPAPPSPMPATPTPALPSPTTAAGRLATAGPATTAEPATAAPTTAEPEPTLRGTTPVVPRRRFFARLLGRRTPAISMPVEPAPPAPVGEPAEPAPPAPIHEPSPVRPLPTPDPVRDPIPMPEPRPDPQPAADEPLPAAQVDGPRAIAVLTGMLDDLGAAHHRPFSRG